MLSLPPSVRIWAASAPADMHKGIDGLAALVRGEMEVDPFKGLILQAQLSSTESRVR